MKRKEYLAIGVTQDNDATCHSRDSSHNVSRKCKAIKRTSSKKIRQALSLALSVHLQEKERVRGVHLPPQDC